MCNDTTKRSPYADVEPSLSPAPLPLAFAGSSWLLPIIPEAQSFTAAMSVWRAWHLFQPNLNHRIQKGAEKVYNRSILLSLVLFLKLDSSEQDFCKYSWQMSVGNLCQELWLEGKTHAWYWKTWELGRGQKGGPAARRRHEDACDDSVWKSVLAAIIWSPSALWKEVGRFLLRGAALQHPWEQWRCGLC